MDENLPRALGMVWYALDDYAEVLRVMEDSHLLPRTYTEWRLKAETGEKRRRREGLIVFRVPLDPKTFPEWCRERGLNVDAKARTRFAAESAYAQYMNLHGKSH